MGRAPVDNEVMACSHWPRAAIPEDYLRPVRSDKPVLIISGYLDPVAGKPWGDTIARTLPNSRHVEVPGASHLPPLLGCTPTLMRQFLGGPRRLPSMSAVSPMRRSRECGSRKRSIDPRRGARQRRAHGRTATHHAA